MSADILIPFESFDPYRIDAYRHVSAWWRSTAPLWQGEVVTCTSDPYTKGAALLQAARRSTADVLVIADADCVPELGYIEAAMRHIKSSGWVVPHTEVVRLGKDGSALVTSGTCAPEAVKNIDYTHRGMAGGGCVVVKRADYLKVPIDPRFEGWGNEDESWAMAAVTLLGRMARLEGKLYHLWHPRAPRLDPFTGSAASGFLRDRYRGARKNPVAMRALLDEFLTV